MKVVYSLEHGMRVDFDPGCPQCDAMVRLDHVIVSAYPYLHADVELICDSCGGRFLFGIPRDRMAGLGAVIWSRDLLGAFDMWAAAASTMLFYCPFHPKTRMVPTKYIGKEFMPRPTSDPDWVMMRLQWKCPECFLTRHEFFPVPRG